jgi:hypothetical protein
MVFKRIGDLRALVVIAIVACMGSKFAIAQAYQQTSLVSDIQGLAQNPPNGQPDMQLLNPWGLVGSPTSPWWVSDNNGGVATLYNGQGVKQGRKYQRVTETILSQENRLVRLLSSRSQQGSSAPQSTPATNFGLSNSGK